MKPPSGPSAAPPAVGLPVPDPLTRPVAMAKDWAEVAAMLGDTSEASHWREVIASLLGQPYAAVSLGPEVGDGSAQRPGPIVLDPAPLTDPELFAPEERREIIGELIESTGACIEEIARHVAAADLPAVRRAAHWARNNALTVGAGDLARTLEAIESASRTADLVQARQSADALGELWQATRAAIELVRDGGR